MYIVDKSYASENNLKIFYTSYTFYITYIINIHKKSIHWN